MARSHRWLAVCAALAALVAVTAIVWPREPGTEGTVPTIANRAAPVGIATARANASSGDGPADAVREAAPRAATPPAEPSPHGTRLRIVDEAGEPVPGAEYFHGSRPHASQGGLLVREAAQELWSPTDAWLRTCTKLVADAGGHVTSYTTDVPYLYVARDRDRLAFWGFPFPDELRFVPERTCDATVVDTNGTPVPGAAIVLRCVHEPILGITDEHGVCRLRHLERLSCREWESDDGHRLGVRGLGLAAADVPIDAHSLPAQLTLTLPPCGTIAVELVNARGERTASPYTITLRHDEREALTEGTRAGAPVIFGHCAVGHAFGLADNASRRSAGPGRAGEQVLLRLSLLDLAPDGLVLTGRARKRDGAPLDARSLAVVDEYGHGIDGGSCDSTDDGGFVFVLAAESRRKLADGCFLVEHAWREGFGLVEVRGAPLRLPEALAGLVDLGDVALLDAVRAARGRVRSGHDLGGLSVRHGYWSGGIDVRTGDDGRFEVWALPHRPSVTLEVRTATHAGRQVHVELPSRDLDIALEPEGKCWVEVTLDADLAGNADSLTAELVAPDGARFRPDRPFGSEKWQASLRVPPGTYRCEVRTAFATEPLAIAAGVVVNAGRENEPVAFDLRGKVRACRLRFVDEANEPVQLSFAYARAVGPIQVVDGESCVASMRCDGTGATILGTGEPLDVLVESSAFRGRYTGPFVDAVITMRPPPMVPFRIADLPPAPADATWTIRAIARAGDAAQRMLTGKETSWRPGGWLFGDVAPDGTGSLALSKSSRYSIELLLVPEDRSPRKFVAIDATSGNVDVGAELPASLTFRFDAKQLSDAVR